MLWFSLCDIIFLWFHWFELWGISEISASNFTTFAGIPHSSLPRWLVRKRSLLDWKCYPSQTLSVPFVQLMNPGKHNVQCHLDVPWQNKLYLFFWFCRYLRYYVPVAHPRYQREFHDKVIIQSHGDNFSRSVVAVYPQGISVIEYQNYFFRVWAAQVAEGNKFSTFPLHLPSNSVWYEFLWRSRAWDIEWTQLIWFYSPWSCSKL